MAQSVTAEWLIAELGLERHPEGGWYRQTFKDDESNGGRAFSTAIYFLLEGNDLSRWHRVDAAETWHFYAGAPLRLTISADGQSADSHVLGTDFAAGQRPHLAGMVLHHRVADGNLPVAGHHDLRSLADRHDGRPVPAGKFIVRHSLLQTVCRQCLS